MVKEIQLYQVKQFPELTKSIVEHGRRDQSKLSNREYQIKFRVGRESFKEKIAATIGPCYQKANSKLSFLRLLEKSGLQTYDRSGEATGVIVDNYKFRFSRLGFTEEKFNELATINVRKKEVGAMRSRLSGRTINHER